jgi:phosphoribosyl-ATP pyrophosphohydrolase/phosphoribosyl-AMP cyclohydrolase
VAFNVVDQIKFGPDGLVPAIVQDVRTGTVIMLAYMNTTAVEKTLSSGETWFWSRSRQKLWHKGETSGHVQKVDEMFYDCDADALLIRVEQTNAGCHEGYYSCFHYKINPKGGVAIVGELAFDPNQVYGKMAPKEEAATTDIKPERQCDVSSASCGVLEELFSVIQMRKQMRPPGAYTSYLFDKGIDKILKKVGEETAEVIISAKNNNRSEIVFEVSDLFYHVLVMMCEKNVNLQDVLNELQNRRK